MYIYESYGVVIPGERLLSIPLTLSSTFCVPLLTQLHFKALSTHQNQTGPWGGSKLSIIPLPDGTGLGNIG